MTSERKRTLHGMAALALVIAAPVALAACSSGGGNTPAAGAGSSGHAATTVPKDPRLAVTNDDAARKDVVLTTCADSAGSWVAKGKVTNSTTAQATYEIEVTYTDSGSTVLGVEKTSVSAAPKQKLSWSTSWPSTRTTGVNCVVDAVSRS
jgi:hypothetical protein